MKIKTKRRICVIVGWLAYLLMFGYIGGMELGTIAPARGAAMAVICLDVWAAALWKAGWIRVR